MAVNAISTTRVSFQQQTLSLLTSLRQSSVDLLVQQNRLSSGRAFTSGSENPVGAAQALDLNGALARQAQIGQNLDHAVSTLNAADGALVEIQTLLSDAQAITSQSLGPLASAEERAANAELIADIIDQLVAVGNRQFNGSFLFAGRDNQVPPLSRAEGGVAFLGDEGDLLAHVAAFADEPINITGLELFGERSVLASRTVDLTPRLTERTRLVDLAGAEGGSIGLGQIVLRRVATNEEVRVDLTGADTIGDIVDRINDRAGNLATASVGDAGINIAPNGQGVAVLDVGGGRLARALGIFNEDGTGGDIIGAALRPRVTRTTRLEDLAGGTGIDTASGLRITVGERTVNVSFEGATTVQEVLNAIEQAGLHLQARINDAGDGIEIVHRVIGVGLSISENGGTSGADLGLLSLEEAYPVSGLGFGQGLSTVDGEADVRVTARDGSQIDVNLDGLSTIGDVLEAFRTAAADAGVDVTFSLSDDGDALQITDNTGGTGVFAVSRLNLSYAIDDLGLSAATLNVDGNVLTGERIAVVRGEGVFTALLDLEAALRADDEQGITAAGSRMEQMFDRLLQSSAIVGARAKSMNDRSSQLDEATLSTQTLLSQVQDLDYAEGVTLFQQAQTALQATLLTASRSFSLSLINFLS